MTDPQQDAPAERDRPMTDPHPDEPLTARDSTIGDEPTESGHGPEELDDVTDDGTPSDGTFGDTTGDTGDTTGDVLDEILANHGTGGFGGPDASGLSNDDALDRPATGDHEVGAQPVELDADAMGRPLSGSANDEDQGMENAGDNAGI